MFVALTDEQEQAHVNFLSNTLCDRTRYGVSYSRASVPAISEEIE